MPWRIHAASTCTTKHIEKDTPSQQAYCSRLEPTPCWRLLCDEEMPQALTSCTCAGRSIIILAISLTPRVCIVHASIPILRASVARFYRRIVRIWASTQQAIGIQRCRKARQPYTPDFRMQMELRKASVKHLYCRASKASPTLGTTNEVPTSPTYKRVHEVKETQQGLSRGRVLSHTVTTGGLLIGGAKIMVIISSAIPASSTKTYLANLLYRHKTYIKAADSKSHGVGAERRKKLICGYEVTQEGMHRDATREYMEKCRAHLCQPECLCTTNWCSCRRRSRALCCGSHCRGGVRRSRSF